MNYTNPIKFNNSLLSNPKTKRLGTKLFWSLFCPTLMIIIAIIISRANGVGLFIIGDPFDNFSNIMIMARTVLLTLIAALALNTNLNSGRMDFSLGATGILAALLAAKIVGDVNTLADITLMMVLTITFGMLIGLVGGLIYIALKLPPIVTSLGMCLVYEGIAKVIAGSNNQVVIKSSAITSNFFLEPIIIFPILIVIIIFYYICYPFIYQCL